MCAGEQLRVCLSFVDGSENGSLPREVPPLLAHHCRLPSVIQTSNAFGTGR